jgi:hypothetical protein
MLFTKIVVFLVLTATSALAITSSGVVDDINAVRGSVVKARKALDSWNGGVLTGVSVVHSVHNACTTAGNARTSIEGSEPFDGEHTDAVLDAYHHLQSELVHVMGVAQKRVSSQKTRLFVK